MNILNNISLRINAADRHTHTCCSCILLFTSYRQRVSHKDSNWSRTSSEFISIQW